MMVIQSMKNSEKEKAIISYLQWNLKKEAVDLQCYTSPAVQDNLRKMIMESCKKEESSAENTEIVKILAPLTDNPNAPDEYGETPIIMATCLGHTEIVKILAPLTDNPNASNKYGMTPKEVAYHYFKCTDYRREYYIASKLRYSAKEIINILQNIYNQKQSRK